MLRDSSMQLEKYGIRRGAKKYYVLVDGKKYWFYSRKYAIENNIEFIADWRKVSNLGGKYILTDNDFVVQVLYDQKTCLKMPGYVFSKLNIYLIYPVHTLYNGRADGRLSIVELVQDKTISSDAQFKAIHYERKGKIQCAIEYLFVMAFRKTLSLDGAVREIWPGLPPRTYRKFKTLILNDGYLVGLLVKDLRDLFERANIDGVNAVKRMEATGDAVFSKMLKELEREEGSIPTEDFLKLASAAYQMNRNIAQITTDQGEDMGLQQIHTRSSVPQLIEPINVE